MRLAALLALAACGSTPAPLVDAAGQTPDGELADAAPVADAPCGSCAPLTTSWEHHYGGVEFGHTVEGIWVDGAGNTYIAGMFEGTIDLGGGPITSAGVTDVLVASFGPAGEYRWAKPFGGAMEDQGTAIAVGGGKVYVGVMYTGDVDFGGGTVPGAGREDAGLLVLDAATGAFVSARGFGTAGDDYTLGVGVDGSGNVTVVGGFATGTLSFDGTHSITGAADTSAFVVSFTATGTHRWSRTLAGSAKVPPAPIALDDAQAVAIDSDGNVTIVGEWMGTADFGAGTVTSSDAANFEFDAFVASYTSTGAPRWSHSFGDGVEVSARTVSVDANGNVVVGGGFHGTVDLGGPKLTAKGIVDGFAMILDTTGATTMARSIGDATGSSIQGVRADSQGNVVVRGGVRAPDATDLGNGVVLPSLGGEDELFVAGFDKTTGAALFGRRWGGPGTNTYAEGAALALSVHDSMAIGGVMSGPVDLGLGTITTGPDATGFAMLVTR